MAVSTYQPYFTVRRLSRRGFCSCVCLPAVFHTVPTVSPGLLLSYAFAGRISHRADCLAGACVVVCACRPYVIPRRLSRQGFCSCVRRAMRLCPGQFSQLPAYLYCRSTCHEKFNCVFGCHYAAETYHRNLNCARHLPNHSYRYGLDRRP